MIRYMTLHYVTLRTEQRRLLGRCAERKGGTLTTRLRLRLRLLQVQGRRTNSQGVDGSRQQTSRRQCQQQQHDDGAGTSGTKHDTDRVRLIDGRGGTVGSDECTRLRML
jgi:hypothetical protein